MTTHPKVGQYRYQRRGRGWRIYVITEVRDNGYTMSPAPAPYDREISRHDYAKDLVYKLNGWTQS